MAWLIAEFIDEQSVSRISEKWLRRNGKKCYYPKTKILMKLKKEAEVNKKSEKWGLHRCRILMNGAKFQTLEEARNAEFICQNHSTMSSYEKSKHQKRRKVPESSCHSESECDNFREIDPLSNQDAGLVDTENKESVYNRKDRNGNNGSDSSPTPTCEREEEDYDDDRESIEEDQRYGHDDTSDGDVNYGGEETNRSSDDVYENQNDESNVVLNIGNNLESTSDLQNPSAVYDFSEDRCLLRIEKLVIHACQELKMIKDDMKALKIKSVKTEDVFENLVTVCKDLAAEVFSCTEELKKRNGMFTDLLVPTLITRD